MFGRKKKKEEPPAQIVLPITAMLDMSFQLLAFFVFTFRPTPSEGQMSMFLPKLDDVSSEPPPSSPLPEEKIDEFTIKVGRQDGEIGELRFKRETDVETLVGNDRIAALRAKLKSIPKPKDVTKQPKLTIEAPPDLRYDSLIHLMDACKAEGYDSVGVAPLKIEKTEAPKE